MNFLSSFPDKQTLLKGRAAEVFEVNGHIHTPYSFSAFDNVPQIFELAVKEDIKVLGINDFIVTDGHKPFHDHAVTAGVFPLFNIEFMGLLKEEQANGIRVNDPNNPGRTYFSGKGLDFPSHPDEETAAKLRKVKEESNRQTAMMVEQLTAFFDREGIPLRLTFEGIRDRFAEELVRERHIAKAVRVSVFEKYATDHERKAILKKIFSGREVQSPLDDVNALENEIRGRLLKAGGPAYVPEDDSAFLEISRVIDIILKMGGIPCYPVLLDDKNGHFTEFEGDFEQLRDTLKAMNVYSVELIPGRNDIDILRQFVEVFDRDDFVITFGTEHNTPELIPLKVTARGGVELDEKLKEISWQGACVIAAHQYLRARGEEGYMDGSGMAKRDRIDEFRALGAKVLGHFLLL